MQPVYSSNPAQQTLPAQEDTIKKCQRALDTLMNRAKYSEGEYFQAIVSGITQIDQQLLKLNSAMVIEECPYTIEALRNYAVNRLKACKETLEMLKNSNDSKNDGIVNKLFEIICKASQNSRESCPGCGMG